MKQKTSVVVGILLISCILPCFALIVDTTKAVDTVMVKYLDDIDFDGLKDTLYYRIQGNSWTKPFTLSFTAKCRGKVLFSENYNEDFVDEELHNTDNFDFCTNSGYLECKKKWYFEILLKQLIIPITKQNEKRKDLFDPKNEIAIPQSLQSFYQDSLKYSKEKARDTAKKIVDIFKKNNLTFFAFPPLPIYGNFPMIFDPHSKKMILIMGF